MRQQALLAVALLACVTGTGCVAAVVSSGVSRAHHKGYERDAAPAQIAIVKANAAATGYVLTMDTVEAFVNAVFGAVEIEPAECQDELGDGLVYCGLFAPDHDPTGLLERPTLAGNYHDAYPADLNGAEPMGPWFKGGHHMRWRYYVLDGMQVIRVQRWESAYSGARLALVFEPAE